MTELVVTEPESDISLLDALEKAGASTGQGLTLPPNLPYDQYEAIGRMLWLTKQKIQFYLGDWLNYGEDMYESDIYVQAAHMTGANQHTLQQWKHVAKAVPPQRRRANVNHSHHAEVTSLSPNDQRRILKLADEQNLTKMQVRDLANEARGKTNHRQEVLDREICSECGRPI